MHFLAASPDIQPITDLINTWIHIGQALVGSVGALAFIFAFLWMKGAVGVERPSGISHEPPAAVSAGLRRSYRALAGEDGNWNGSHTPTPRS